MVESPATPNNKQLYVAVIAAASVVYLCCRQMKKKGLVRSTNVHIFYWYLVSLRICYF